MEVRLGDKRYQIFLSSTYLDLVSERARALRELAGSDYIATGMEYFPAMDEEQFEFIKSIISGADYYVCIIAGKYGSLASDGVSYSEKEYDFARELGIPVIALLRRDIHELSEHLRESDPARVKALDNFRTRLSSGRLAAYWKDEAELCLRLLGSLSAMTKKFPRSGWVRGGANDPEILICRIQELESTSSVLESELDGLRNAALTEIIRERLAASNATITYDYEQEGKTVERYSATYDWEQLANFLFPRLMSQKTDEGMMDILREYLAQDDPTKMVVRIETESLNSICDTFTASGLVTSSKNGFGTKLFLLSDMGFKYARPVIQKYRPPEVIKRELRASQVFGDLGDFLAQRVENGIDRFFSWMFRIRKK